MSQVDIGFVESCESWRVESAQFPSKVGGKPAWLAYENFPTFDDLQCESCGLQTIFLCQVYAPFEDTEENFHRTVFIFICRSVNCNSKNSSGNFKVFRCNLPRNNTFYSYHPPSADEPAVFDSSKWAQLCTLCGCPGSRTCGKCKVATYCCREHQVIDWKETHKQTCGTNAKPASSKYLFKELEITMDTEEIDDKEVDEAKELETYERLKETHGAGTLADISDDDLSKHASVDTDKAFRKFRKRIELYPEQVMRYERGGQPLWIADAPLPDGVRDCEYCGSPRQFEFQILPQILSELKEYDLDFGVLAMYTCKKSCWEPSGYKREVVFRQDVSDKH